MALISGSYVIWRGSLFEPQDYTDLHKPFLKKKSFTKRTFFLLAQVFFFPKKEKVLC